ncbi:flagellar protein FlaG [Natranaerovirga pectinivora]|uniref:Flagellar protein FlaG n=1 Tax=Natranaerovirga pectinivora TaxID=682400 RepID=A0A4R3MKQ7_9FIRM|nr:flagellar protein FlaG [Natranaerovirga pectinivora]TCT14045.1 flagellar protein FlaG [Natranaerovirga pectinivora]
MRIESMSNTMPVQSSKAVESVIKVGQDQQSKAQSNPQDKQVQERDIIHAIEKANKEIRTYDRKLEFSIHEGTKEIVVKVINTSDDTVIREIPSERILDMVAKMWEMAGLLVDEKR